MYDLQRFLKAQERDYETALQEICNGRKVSHWIWYIFPQVKGLGFSSTSEYYGIEDLDEAKAYLGNYTLKERLLEISAALLDLETNNAREVMGSPDHLKLKSSMTLFAMAEPNIPIFKQVIDKYYDGVMDEKTMKILKK